MKKIMVFILLLVLVGCGSEVDENYLKDFQSAFEKFEQVESCSYDAKNEVVVNQIDEIGEINHSISVVEGKFLYTKEDAYNKFTLKPGNNVVETWFSDGKQFLILNNEKYINESTYQEYKYQISAYTQLIPIELVDEDVESVLLNDNIYSIKLTESGSNKLFEANDILFKAVMGDKFEKDSVTVEKYDVTIVDGNIEKLDVSALVKGKIDNDVYEVEYSETIAYSDLNSTQITNIPSVDDFLGDVPVTDGIVVTNLDEFKAYLTSAGFVGSDDEDIFTLVMDDKITMYGYQFSTQTHFMEFKGDIYEYYWETDSGKTNDCVVDFQSELIGESCSEDDLKRIKSTKESFFIDIDYLGITDYSILK